MNEENFKYLAERDPQALARIVRQLLREQRVHLLTFAAEAFGYSDDSGLAIETVLPLMSHPNATVREGAVYGLAPHVDREVARRFRDILGWEPSPGVRAAITDVLESRTLRTTNVLRTAVIVGAAVCATASLIALGILAMGSWW